MSGWSRDRLIAEIRLLEAHLDRLMHEGQDDRARAGDTDDDSEGGDHEAGRYDELKTVRVPEPFTEPFLHAQGFVERYFQSLIHRPEQATISIAGERYVLMRAASMSVEFVDLVTSLYQDRGPREARNVANNLLFDLAHALGKADALSFQQKMGLSEPIDNLSAGPIHFAFSGWAFVDIHPDSNPTPDENYFLRYDHPFSFESHSWVAKGKSSDEPVCVMNAGYSSGWCEESFGLPLVAAEVECVAAGGSHCRFIMAPPSRIESHLARFGHQVRGSKAKGKPQVNVPEFFQRRRLEDELRRANASLEERVDERTAELRQATDRLRLLATAVDHAVEGIVTLNGDPEGRLTIQTVNQGFTQVCGIPESEALGRGLEVLSVVAGDQSRLHRLADHVREGTDFETELNALRPDGTEYTLEVHVMPGNGVHGRPDHWIGLFRDVTRRRRYLAELRRQATYDALTGLPNRVLLYDRLEQQVKDTLQTQEPMALLVIDLDGFKEVNDTFGHHAGDTLLEQVGPRLRSRVRKSDFVARLGGDEFAVLFTGIQSQANARAQAEVLLDCLHEPFEVQGQELVIGASLGIVLCPVHGEDASTLLRRADVAMYVAKKSRLGIEVYRPEDDVYSPERLALVGDLRTGIDRGELRIHYQPQVTLASRRPCRFEALVRWQHPEQGLLQPGEFVPFIELGNLVERLTDWVLENAVADCAAWHRAGHGMEVSVNIAPRSVRDKAFPDRINQVLERHGLDPRFLTLEVTESGLLIDPERSLPVFEQLRAAGVRLSIDDFGTGYSSFAHLRTLPVDEIKIDRSFVSNMMEDEQDAAIVQSTIQLGRSIGREIVAEGVEDQPTLDRLAELACDAVQGYHVARPMPGDEVRDWISARG